MAKVIGTSKLRTKYESHEAKRNLCAAYDLFLADERILPSLPKLLGASHQRLLLSILARAPVLCTGTVVCVCHQLFLAGRRFAPSLLKLLGVACSVVSDSLCLCTSFLRII